MTEYRGIVISGFDRTANMVRPWADAGYLCYCIDIQHELGERRDGNIVFVGADMLTWQPDFDVSRVVFQSYFPPCTDLAVSGARWFPEKGLDALAMAIQLFSAAIKLGERIKAPYIIENPVSTISSYWRKPDYSFNPFEYAGYEGGGDDLYTKKTCLWTNGNFKMPEPRPRKPEKGSMMHLMPPSPDRANLRSATPMGFARAVFEANSPHLRGMRHA